MLLLVSSTNVVYTNINNPNRNRPIQEQRDEMIRNLQTFVGIKMKGQKSTQDMLNFPSSHLCNNLASDAKKHRLLQRIWSFDGFPVIDQLSLVRCTFGESQIRGD